jgi:hypothetical protein
MARKLTSEESEFQKQTKLKLGRRIYSGDGNIYHIHNYPNRLVKIRSTRDTVLLGSVEILKYLKRSNNPSVVKIHNIGSFTTTRNGFVDGTLYTVYHYYYVMDKLKPLSRKNRRSKVVDITNFLEEGKRLSKETSPQLKKFVSKARGLKYKYGDIHEYNIMQNTRGDLKFVDLESFMFHLGDY